MRCSAIADALDASSNTKKDKNGRTKLILFWKPSLNIDKRMYIRKFLYSGNAIMITNNRTYTAIQFTFLAFL